uniref:Metallo-beta-lactamase domain-containing protein n=1 Tax=Chlamydomonas euryale TaxID=1486919 RepID=A0A7R9VFK0_9CHLO|mmetsp:Transcript_34193/g.101625  ORF Transcript_34193/g.101625 Transcript_34193/m.101625 type:complete len:372 (+) Transcript_34193:294-1409(+)
MQFANRLVARRGLAGSMRCAATPRSAAPSTPFRTTDQGLLHSPVTAAAGSHSGTAAASARLLSGRRGAAGVAQSASQAAPSASSSPTSFHHGVTCTSYEGNCIGVKFNNSGVRVLIDPWLEGDLTFFNQDWVYRGKKRVINARGGGSVDTQQLLMETDVVVLTQYLDDHCHEPTLQKVPRNMLIVANPEAADRIKPMGFTNVRVLDHGQTVAVADGRMTITATEGALVGPPWSKRQNGVTFREAETKDGSHASLYFEAHCDFTDASIAKLGSVDVVVTPVESTILGSREAGVGYPVVMGDINLMRLLKQLRPKVLVPLLNAQIDAEGPLSPAVFQRGDVAAVRQQLADAGLSTRLEMPAPPGETLAIALSN